MDESLEQEKKKEKEENCLNEKYGGRYEKEQRKEKEEIFLKIRKLEHRKKNSQTKN